MIETSMESKRRFAPIQNKVRRDICGSVRALEMSNFVFEQMSEFSSSPLSLVILNDLRESMIGTQIRQGKSSLLNEQLQELLPKWKRPTLLLE